MPATAKFEFGRILPIPTSPVLNTITLVDIAAPLVDVKICTSALPATPPTLLVIDRIADVVRAPSVMSEVYHSIDPMV